MPELQLCFSTPTVVHLAVSARPPGKGQGASRVTCGRAEFAVRSMDSRASPYTVSLQGEQGIARRVKCLGFERESSSLAAQELRITDEEREVA